MIGRTSVGFADDAFSGPANRMGLRPGCMGHAAPEKPTKDRGFYNLKIEWCELKGLVSAERNDG
jgi:hypothetical protein